MDKPISPLECVLDAWVKVLADFRAWMKAETSHAQAWKARPFSQAVVGIKSQLIDDAEAMLAEWRKNENAPVTGGGTALIPVLMTAVATAAQPPDVDQIKGIPYWVDVVVTEDGVDRYVKVRAVPKAVRAQIVYFSTTPHDAASISDQFCAYMTDDAKRRFKVHFHDISDPWEMTVLENSLFPDVVPTEAKNLTIISIDLTMIGLVPQIKDEDADTGFAPETGTVNPGQQESLDVVIQADQFDQDTDQHHRINADPDTGVITELEVVDP